MSNEHNAVAWTRVAGPIGGKTGAHFEWSVTVRGDNPDGMIASIEEYERKLIAAGCIPIDAYVDQRKNERQIQSPPDAAPSESGRQTPQNGNGNVLTCVANELMAMPKSTNDPTLIWKVKTDKSKYPVPMYIEVCREIAPMLKGYGIDLDVFIGDNGQPAKYSLNGWRAHYVQNDKGWPAKIVRLIK